MKCPICGKDVELQKKQVGTNEHGEPVFNEYAICRDCKKQWNLDKQRAKKAAEKKAAAKTPETKPNSGAAESEASVKKAPAKKRPTDTAAKKRPADAPVKKQPSDSPSQKPSSVDMDQTRRVMTADDHEIAKDSPKKARRRPESDAVSSQKRRPEDGTAPQNRRPEDAAAPRKRRPEDAAAPRKRRPEDAAAPRKRHPEENAAPRRRRPEDVDAPRTRRPEDAAAKKRPQGTQTAERSESDEQKYGNIPSEQVRTKREKAVRKGYEDMLSTDPAYTAKKHRKAAADKDNATKSSQRHINAYDDYDDDDILEDEYVPAARFRVLRVIFGILSVLAFGYLVYSGLMNGLDGISSGTGTSTGTTYIILSLCMLVSGLLLLIMQKSNNIFAFLLPLAIYLGEGVFAFLKRSEDGMLLYFAIAGAVLAVFFLILTIASRGGSAEEDYNPDEDYDDPFEDDYE